MDTQRRTVRRTEKQAEMDLATHIKAKLQEYSQVITSLEAYKSLCERRILELSPGHPLPVTEDYVGKTLPRSVSLKGKDWQTPSKLSKFETPESRVNVRKESDLRDRLEQVEREKADLESSLRAEVLHSEEQRAYIEALKQAVESKMTAIGLSDMSVLDYCRAAQDAEQHQESKLALAKMQGALISQEELIQQLRGQIALAESRSETANLKRELDHTHEAFQQAVSDMNKLEEEKNSLLEYIEDHKRQEGQLQELLETIEPELVSIKREHEEMREKHEQTVDQLQTTQRSLDQLHRENRDLGALVQRLETEAKDLTRELGFSEKREKELSAESMLIHAKMRAMTVNQTTLAETLQETQGELDAVQAANAELGQELQKAQEELGEIGQIREEMDCLRAKNEEEIENQRNIIENLEESLKSTQSRLKEEIDSKSQLERLVSALKSSLAEMTEKATALEEFQGKYVESEVRFSSLTASFQEAQRSQLEASEKYAKLSETHEAVLAELRKMALVSSTNTQLQEEMRNLKLELGQNQQKVRDLQGEKTLNIGKMEALIGENQSCISQLTVLREAEHTAKLELQRVKLDLEEARGAVFRLGTVLKGEEMAGNSAIWRSGDLVSILDLAKQEIESISSENAVKMARFDGEIASLRGELEKCMEKLERREAELAIAHKEIDDLRLFSDQKSTNEQQIEALSQDLAAAAVRINQAESEIHHFRDLDQEKTLKSALLECRISGLMHENEDLESLVASIYTAFSQEEAAPVLEKMIRALSALQQLYKDQHTTESLRLLSSDQPSTAFEPRITAIRRSLAVLGEDLKAVVALERRRVREWEGGLGGKQGGNAGFKGRTLVDRLNLPKVRSEVMKVNSSLDSD